MEWNLRSTLVGLQRHHLLEVFKPIGFEVSKLELVADPDQQLDHVALLLSQRQNLGHFVVTHEF